VEFSVFMLSSIVPCEFLSVLFSRDARRFMLSLRFYGSIWAVHYPLNMPFCWISDGYCSVYVPSQRRNASKTHPSGGMCTLRVDTTMASEHMWCAWHVVWYVWRACVRAPVLLSFGGGPRAQRLDASSSSIR
jgi:hypothetical protein